MQFGIVFMELRQLSYFVAVAEELHFGRAAMRVNIAQPALSTQVQALEKGLGVQLLTRSTRKVELTRAGEVFYDRCVRMLGELDLSAEMARAAGGGCWFPRRTEPVRRIISIEN
ncbi:MAG: hypothetical protein ABS40_21075 [Agrobacterium sp. SCN 61-19]|nr:MAG: hypothetical protein ABS40_21075 [Agrobacterium sp. SCN 61-19]